MTFLFIQINDLSKTMISPEFSCDFKAKKFCFLEGGHIPLRYLTINPSV